MKGEQLPFRKHEYPEKRLQFQHSVRMRLPNWVSSKLSTYYSDFTVEHVAGKHSFVKCLLYMFDENYDGTIVSRRVLDAKVEKVREYLDKNITVKHRSNKSLGKFRKSQIEKGVNSEDRKNIEALYYISYLLNVNIIIISDDSYEYIYPEREKFPYKVTVMMYCSNDGVYSPVTYNREGMQAKRFYLYSESPEIKTLVDNAPDENIYLKSLEESKERAKKKAALTKMSKAELVKLAVKEGLSTKDGNGKELAKSAVIELILQYGS